ncbi:hypothetical protein [Bacillus sp. OK048]|uniref:hypothetical protein n=1 Tax=Bacillus sp. OK048 TaxID=1882761 RepID=UPI000886DB5D|nr:hypothetical protein [Bacillus sp. OK048]SDM86943.1 hypothetical protein SAMN05443253_106110 [Bacillus sp. OK048]
MGKEFSNKNSVRLAAIAAAIIGIIGIGVITIHVLLGILALLLAVVVSFLFYIYGNDTTVICHEDGFTVKNTNRGKGTSIHEYGWQEVAETKFYDNVSEEDHLPTRSILVKTTGGLAFNLYAMKGFDELISIINQKTKHLPYKWEKPGAFSHTYKKQERSFS